MTVSQRAKRPIQTVMFWAVTLCVLVVGVGVSVLHSATVVSVAVDLDTSSSCLSQRLGLSRPPKFCLLSATPVLSHPTANAAVPAVRLSVTDQCS